MQKDQYIVASNKIKLENIENRRVRASLQVELATLYKQRELPDIFIGKSKVGAYYWFRSQENFTPKRYQRWLYSSLSNQPSIYSVKLRDATVKNMEQYLYNAGYLYPSVKADHDFGNKEKGLMNVTYTVNPGRLYVIDKMEYFCNDEAVGYLLRDTRDKSLLSKGQPLDLKLFEQEKQRITTVLNNFGYARFTPNYVTQLESDTSEVHFDKNGNRLVNIVLTVQTPGEGLNHQKFTVGDVTVFPNFDARRGERAASFDTMTADNKKFKTYDGNIGVKLVPLSNAISLKPKELFSKEKNDQTIRLLTNLGIYKFVNIKPNISESDSTAISYKIYLTPAKKMSLESGLEVNLSTVSNISNSSNSAWRIGLAGDFGFNHRNLFGGAERFSSRLSLGSDRPFALSNQKGNGLSYDIRFENTLSIPKFINVSQSWRLFRHLNLITEGFYKDLKESASSDFTLNYVLSDRLNWGLYRLQQLNIGTRYVLKRANGSQQYTINTTGAELQRAELDTSFAATANERLKRSLATQFMTSFAARSLHYEWTGKVNPLGERWQFIGTLEQSGAEILLAEKLLNQGSAFSIANISFSKFLRAEADVRYNRQLSPKRVYAARLSIGLAQSLDNAPVPYSRQFFLGGPNSIRGWVIRDIGPGGYKDSASVSAFPYQAGDVKIEFNSELRFPLFWRFNSAVFFDAGNIWNLKKDDKLPNGNFTKYWINQIAISSGLGLRLDVTYAIIRLDLGYRLRNPYETADGKNWIPFSQWRHNINPNFALGFPF